MIAIRRNRKALKIIPHGLSYPAPFSCCDEMHYRSKNRHLQYAPDRYSEKMAADIMLKWYVVDRAFQFEVK